MCIDPSLDLAILCDPPPPSQFRLRSIGEVSPVSNMPMKDARVRGVRIRLVKYHELLCCGVDANTTGAIIEEADGVVQRSLAVHWTAALDNTSRLTVVVLGS